jgi:hypothetical protein
MSLPASTFIISSFFDSIVQCSPCIQCVCNDASGLVYESYSIEIQRGLHRIFCRISSVAVFFVEFTFWQIFHKFFGTKFHNFRWMFVYITIKSHNHCFYYPKSTPRLALLTCVFVNLCFLKQTKSLQHWKNWLSKSKILCSIDFWSEKSNPKNYTMYISVKN